MAEFRIYEPKPQAGQLERALRDDKYEGEAIMRAVVDLQRAGRLSQITR